MSSAHCVDLCAFSCACLYLCVRLGFCMTACSCLCVGVFLYVLLCSYRHRASLYLRGWAYIRDRNVSHLMVQCYWSGYAQHPL